MRKFWLLGFFLFGLRLAAQEYLVKHYTINDGLSNDEVFCFAQDTLGVMWIGTDNGLSSFDGQEFKSYFLEDGLAGSSITALLLDKKGQLWANGYSKGISIREQQGTETKWKFVNNYKSGIGILEHQDKFWEVYGNTVTVSDSSGVITRYGLRKYMPGNLTGFFRNPSRVNIELSPTGEEIWLGSYMGLISIGADMKSKVLLPPESLPRLVSEIAHLADNSSLLGGPGIVRRYKNGKIIRTYDLGLEDTFRIHRILPVGNEAWIAAEGYGLLSLNLQSGKVTFQKDLLGIDSEIIHNLFLDEHENIWVGTRGNGVYCLQPSLITKHPVRDLLCEKSIISLNSLPGGELLILSPSGLIIRSKTGVYSRFLCDSKSNNYDVLANQDKPLILSTDLRGLLPENSVLNTSAAIILAKDDVLLTGYQDYPYLNKSREHIQRLYRARFNQGSWETIQKITLEFSNKGTQIRNIFLDSAGYFWVGTHQDSLWMGTVPLAQLTGKDPVVSTIGFHLSQLESTVVDPQGTIWVCGRRSIWKKDPDELEFNVFLEGGPFFQMEIEPDGKIWVSKNDGLISIQNGQAIAYPLSGYQDLSQIDAMHIPPGSDTLWLASREGLFSISLPELIRQEIPEIQPFLTEITINQEPLFSHDRVSLEVGEAFQLSVSSAVFYSGIQPRFRYRTNEGGWIETKSGVINLPTTAPGFYLVAISSALPGGSWGKSFNIEYEVRPGFWLHPLTWICFVTLIGLTAFFIAQFQINKSKMRDAKEREIQQEFHRLEQQAFSAMLNPHFIFNTINSIQQELLEEDPIVAHRHLSKFAKLIRKNMDLTMRPKISLFEELERLALYLEMEKIRLGDKIETVIQADPLIPLADVEIPSMILQPFVENAIWHGILLTGETGTVTVRVGLTENNQIRIEIEDDGIGIDIARSRVRPGDHISLGISITQARIASFHDESRVTAEQVNDEAGISKGTLVTIIIPLKIQLRRDS